MISRVHSARGHIIFASAILYRRYSCVVCSIDLSYGHETRVKQRPFSLAKWIHPYTPRFVYDSRNEYFWLVRQLKAVSRRVNAQVFNIKLRHWRNAGVSDEGYYKEDK